VRQIFEHESIIAAPAQKVFSFHERPDALRLLIPPWQPIQVLQQVGGIQNGARVVLKMGYAPFSIQWVAFHQGYVSGVQFEDVQEKGPFQFWKHTHFVMARSHNSCVLRDHVEYEFMFGSILHGFIRRQLVPTFVYRHRICALHTC
jgi:ligand-binding SRPBCC domain-containing protein